MFKKRTSLIARLNVDKTHSVRALLAAISLLTVVLSPELTGQSWKSMAQRRLDPRVVNRNSLFKPTAKTYGLPMKVGNSIGPPKIKGILQCNQNETTCTVMHMPLLWQTDPLIDSDVQDMGPWGCYDTSILTVILTDLANRDKSLVPQLKNRSKTLEDIPAGIGGNGQPATKEIKQLSQEYRWAKQGGKGVQQNGKTVQPFYFHEVVADLGKINELCDPYTYGNCSEASNSIADASRTFIKTENITSEYIKNLMKSGYAVMIAYARYNPVVSQNTAGGLDVRFELDSLHKVVFSGFQSGDYALTINDVGNGQRYRVRLSSDLSGRNFAVNSLPQNGLKPPTGSKASKANNVIYPSDTKIFLEYEGTGQGENDQVFFIQHVDSMRITPAGNPLQRLLNE